MADVANAVLLYRIVLLRKHSPEAAKPYYIMSLECKREILSGVNYDMESYTLRQGAFGTNHAKAQWSACTDRSV